MINILSYFPFLGEHNTKPRIATDIDHDVNTLRIVIIHITLMSGNATDMDVGATMAELKSLRKHLYVIL